MTFFFSRRTRKGLAGRFSSAGLGLRPNVQDYVNVGKLLSDVDIPGWKNGSAEVSNNQLDRILAAANRVDRLPPPMTPNRSQNDIHLTSYGSSATWIMLHSPKPLLSNRNSLMEWRARNAIDEEGAAPYEHWETHTSNNYKFVSLVDPLIHSHHKGPRWEIGSKWGGEANE